MHSESKDDVESRPAGIIIGWRRRGRRGGWIIISSVVDRRGWGRRRARGPERRVWSGAEMRLRVMVAVGLRRAAVRFEPLRPRLVAGRLPISRRTRKSNQRHSHCGDGREGDDLVDRVRFHGLGFLWWLCSFTGWSRRWPGKGYRAPTRGADYGLISGGKSAYCCPTMEEAR